MYVNGVKWDSFLCCESKLNVLRKIYVVENIRASMVPVCVCVYVDTISLNFRLQCRKMNI